MGCTLSTPVPTPRNPTVKPPDAAVNAGASVPRFAMSSAFSHSRAGSQAAAEAFDKVRGELPGAPSVLFVYCTPEYDCQAVMKTLAARAPRTPMMGGTCQAGSLTESGWHEDCLVMLGIYDPKGFYSVGSAPLKTRGTGLHGKEAEDLWRKASASAFRAAYSSKERPQDFRQPNALWIMSEMDSEEGVLRGLSDALLSEKLQACAIGGGSSGAAEGPERPDCQFANGSVLTNSVVVCTFFSSANVVAEFCNAYSQTPGGHNGIITKADDTHRVCLEIDGRPAAEVYNEWTDKALDKFTENKLRLLPISAEHPLGRVKLIGEHGEPQFLLAQPGDVLTDVGGLRILAEISGGERVFQMSGNGQSLVNNVKHMAQRIAASAKTNVHGCLMAMCVSYTTFKDKLPQCCTELSAAMKGKPFIGPATMGEQGTFHKIEGIYAHGNLMFSCFTFCGVRDPSKAWVLSAPAPPTGDVALISITVPAPVPTELGRSAKAIFSQFLQQHTKGMRAFVLPGGPQDDARLQWQIVAPSAMDAITLSLDVHNLCMTLSWPGDLLALPGFGEEHDASGTLLWRGPRFRVCVAFGHPLVEFSPVVQYKGPVVELVAKLQESCPVGFSLVTDPAKNEAEKSMSAIYEYQLPLDQIVPAIKLRRLDANPSVGTAVHVLCANHLCGRQ